MDPENTESFRRQIEDLLPYVGSLLAYPWDAPPINGWLTGGSILFACSASSRFLVTADHVIREIDELRGSQRIAFLLGGVCAPPEEISNWKVIDRNSSLDVCTIKIPDTFSPSQINKRLLPLDWWPLPLAQVGDRAIIVGYPAEHRAGHGSTVNARCLPIGDFVTDVGPRRFTIADEMQAREVVINPESLSFPNHLGGMSGSPVFRIHDQGDADFLGVFSEGGDGLRGAYFCSHAFLLPDGRIDYSRLPPMSTVWIGG